MPSHSIPWCLPGFVAMLLTIPADVSGESHPADDAILFGALFPRISSSGEKTVFSYQGAIWSVPSSGGVMRQLTEGQGFDVEPAWSADEKTIAFIRGRASFVGQLQLINAVSGETVDLSSEVIAKDKLFFHPDGKRILGCFRRESGPFSIGWLDLETGQLGPEIRTDQWGQRYALSCDGASIALATTRDLSGEQGGNNGPQCDIWVIPSDGGEATQITRFPGRVYELGWTADNKSLTIVSNVGGVHNDLWQVPLDNPETAVRQLTFGQADEDQASVSADGRWMLYTDNRLGPTALVLRDLPSRTDSMLSVNRMNYLRPTGKLTLSLSDHRQSVTARVSLKRIGGKHYAPHGRLYRMLRGDVHFYHTGQATFDLPSGQYLLKVARGPEYPLVRREVEVPVGSTATVDIELQRWTNQRSRGWYSGESHIHANYGYGQWYNSPRTMLRQSAGEDLNVSNFMVANSEADGVFDRQYFRGTPDPLSTTSTVLYWNEEFRSTIWGHLTLLNLKQLVEPIFTGFEHTTHPHDHPTNADIADLTHDQDGHVNYTHPAHNVKDPYLSAYSAKALPLDVALGRVDSIDVMGSNHVATMSLWYRLLNCGFKIPASAGTDCFLNRVRSSLPGQDRVYVYVEGDFSYQRWIEGLRSGRTFVTNGPMFEFRVDDQLPGSTVQLPVPGTVHLLARVTSHYPLDRAEIIFNGEVVGSAEIVGEQRDIAIDQQVSIPRSGWLAVRSGGPPQADQPRGSVFGHTAPVYVQVAGHPVQASKDAKYFVGWIERLRTEIRRRNRIPPRHKVHVETQMAQALEVFKRLVAGERE